MDWIIITLIKSLLNSGTWALHNLFLSHCGDLFCDKIMRYNISVKIRTEVMLCKNIIGDGYSHEKNYLTEYGSVMTRVTNALFTCPILVGFRPAVPNLVSAP